MGISMTALPEQHAASGLLPKGEGILIERIIPGSSAEKAGLLKGDVLAKINDDAIRSSADVIGVVRANRAGAALRLSLIRDGKREERIVQLIGQPLETTEGFETIYEAVDVEGVLRRTIVTKPPRDGKQPAVLFVGGVGCYSMDYPFDEKANYRQILSSLTRQGFVTMRVEKSGMGDSEGAPCSQVDMLTEVKGYVAGLKALKAKPFVNADKVFIVGHSIGGIVGPLVADEEPVRGIVAMSTIGSTWFEYELINRRRQLKLAGTEPQKIGRQMQLKQWCMNALLIERQPRAQILEKRPECAAEMEIPSSDSYLQQIAAQDLPGLWTRLKPDTLLIYGSADFLTSSDEHREILDVLNAARPGSATFVEIADMDHYFYKMKDQKESFLARREDRGGEVHTELGNIIGSWLKERI
ncbi:alpha/beta fold hydrolase [Microvirga flavescens]|uniref:alpha/beta fold hydrolase n=1 Tax=Microvirga flavescens TaxID=2249811 RepID=UPI0018E0B2FF|nr:alpha/beta fold hydrolase [Microvirga flavescens]